MGPLELNYMCKHPDYFEKGSANCPTTAPKTSSKRKRVKIDDNPTQITMNSRMQICKTSQGQRSNSALNIEHNTLSPKSPISDKQSKLRPSTQGHQFPEDFCIENTLNQYPFQFNAKYGIGDFDLLEKKDNDDKSEKVNESEANATEMILHMKGPIYSVAERNQGSSNVVMQQFAKRMYFTKANAEQFFRKPIQIYPSLVLINPNKTKMLSTNEKDKMPNGITIIISVSSLISKIDAKKGRHTQDYDYTSKSPIQRIKRVVATSKGKRLNNL